MTDALLLHAHRVFDLEVASCLALPAAARSRDARGADVVIADGAVPTHLPDTITIGLRYEVAAGRVLLSVDGVARFLIEEGRRITVAREPQADEDDVRAFLIGPVFGALLQQRGELVLRACAVARDGAAVLLIGHSGTGKSSVAAALGRRGWAVFADELGVIRARADGTLTVVPGWTELKLWPSAIGSAGEWPCVRRGVEKRRLPLAPCDRVLRLARIYALRRAAGGARETVTGQQKLTLINRHAYRPEFLATPAERVEQQRRATRLAQAIPLELLPRATKQQEFEALAEQCAADFRA